VAYPISRVSFSFAEPKKLTVLFGAGNVMASFFNKWLQNTARDISW